MNKKISSLLISFSVLVMITLCATTSYSKRNHPSYSPELEQKLQEVWKEYHAALKNKDAVKAVSYLVPNMRKEVLEDFLKYKDKLPKLAEDINDIELDEVYYPYARCLMFRKELVKGKEMAIGYTVIFINSPEGWKLERP